MSGEPTNLFLPSVIDFSALVVVLLDAYFGFRRGLSGEVARFFCLVLGVALTVMLLHPVGSMCFRYANPLIPDDARHAFAFVASTLAAAAILLLVHRPVYNWIDRDSPKHQNKFGGLIAGLMRGIIGVMFVMIVLNLWPTAGVTKAIGESSIAGKTANRLLPIIKGRLEGRKADPAPAQSGSSRGLLRLLRDEKNDRTTFSR